MKFKLSKLAVATVCMFSSVTLDTTSRNLLNSENYNFGEASLALMKGLRWGINEAQACRGGAYSDCVNSDIEHIVIVYSPPDNDWEWDYDPFGGNDYSDNDYEGGDGGSGSSGDGQSEASQQPLISSHSQRDIALAVSSILVELNNLKLQLSGILSASEMAKLNRLISGAQIWVSMLNSGVQISEHTIEQNYNAAFAEFGALLAGVVISVGGTVALSTVTAPAVAGMIAGIAAYSIANMVEAQLNEMKLADAIDNYFNTDIADALDSYRDDNGETFDEAWNRFNCAYTVCTQIPPIILDLDGDGLEMSRISDSKAYMDFDNDGYDELLSWVTGDDGILYIDLNRSGKLDDYEEFALASHAGVGKSDLDGLKTFDSNNDGVFNEFDESYPLAGVWIDKNANAIPDESELVKLSDFGITDISLQDNGNADVAGDSVSLDRLKFKISDSNGSVSEGLAYNVMITATYHGKKVKRYDDGTRIISKESGLKLVDFKKNKDDIQFNVGHDSYDNTSDFSAIRTGKGNDVISVSAGYGVFVNVGKGNDTVIGGSHNDRIQGRKGNDILSGMNGDDTIKGQSGDDIIQGNDGNDGLFGGTGDDTLDGGLGNDYLHGGKGKDKFIVGLGYDTIADFNVKSDKMVVVGHESANYQAIMESAIDTVHGAKLVTDYGVIYLLDVRKSDLKHSNFIFE